MVLAGVPMSANAAVVGVETGVVPDVPVDPRVAAVDGDAVLMGTDWPQPFKAQPISTTAGQQHPADICAIPCIQSPSVPAANLVLQRVFAQCVD
jgi:hypothetical protein